MDKITIPLDRLTALLEMQKTASMKYILNLVNNSDEYNLRSDIDLDQYQDIKNIIAGVIERYGQRADFPEDYITLMKYIG